MPKNRYVRRRSPRAEKHRKSARFFRTMKFVALAGVASYAFLIARNFIDKEETGCDNPFTQEYSQNHGFSGENAEQEDPAFFSDLENITEEEIESYYQHIIRERPAHIQALLDTIAWAEGTDFHNQSGNSHGYSMLYGGTRFRNMERHPAETGEMPRNGIRRWNLTSTASGRYQVLRRTSNDLSTRGIYDDFSPASQDEAAIHLINRRGVSEEDIRNAAETGSQADMNSILDRLSREWASLPQTNGRGHYSNQTVRRQQDINNFYLTRYDQLSHAGNE